MASAEMRITVRRVTVDQLLEEVGKLKFAGYGNAHCTFSLGGPEVLSVTAQKDLGTLSRPAVKAAPTKAAK